MDENKRADVERALITLNTTPRARECVSVWGLAGELTCVECVLVCLSVLMSGWR